MKWLYLVSSILVLSLHPVVPSQVELLELRWKRQVVQDNSTDIVELSTKSATTTVDLSTTSATTTKTDVDEQLVCLQGNNNTELVNNTCRCTNCGTDPPDCNILRCNGKEITGQTCLPCSIGRGGQCCDQIACLNGGVSLTDSCDCRGTEFEGYFCERVKAMAASNITCENGGTLNAQSLTCNCTIDYTGTSCEIPKCYDNQENVNGKCNCSKNYYGKFCESIKCRRLGKPVINVDARSVHCKCNVLFFGEFCQDISLLGYFILILIVILFVAIALFGLACVCLRQIRKLKRRKKVDADNNPHRFSNSQNSTGFPTWDSMPRQPLKASENTRVGVGSFGYVSTPDNPSLRLPPYVLPQFDDPPPPREVIYGTLQRNMKIERTGL